MIDFEGYYHVAAEQIEYIDMKTNANNNAPFGLFLHLTSGKELGVWYRTEALRKAGYAKLTRQIESEKRQNDNAVLGRLYQIEAIVNRVDKRTLRIWRQLKGLLHLEGEEAE